jgi:hypothetical protein
MNANQKAEALRLADNLDKWPVGPSSETCFEAAALLRTLAAEPAPEPVAWRWSESNGIRWFAWTSDWYHHEKAKKLGDLIEYAYAHPPKAEPAPEPVHYYAESEKVITTEAHKWNALHTVPLDAMREVLRISDRKHWAWDEVKAW